MSAKKLFSIILVLAISMLSLHKVIYFQNITITNNEKTSYSTKIIYDDTVREGTRFVKKQGVDGSKAVTYSVTKNIFGKEQVIRDINAKLEAVVKSNGATWINVNPAFCDEEGNLRSDLTNDGLHLLGPGYLMWRDLLLPYILE